MTISYFTAATLDGYQATTDDRLDWLFTRDHDPDGPHGLNGLLDRYGALIMGGVTYRWVIQNLAETGDEWPYPVPTWVFSHHAVPTIEADVRFVRGQPRDHISAIIESAAGRDVWLVGGGELAAQFLHQGLIDELWVQFAPVLIGQGKPFLPAATELALVEVVRNRDLVCTRYDVLR